MNLRVTYRGEVVFTHDGHWLHPLFELELFLHHQTFSRAELSLTDKIIGRGAAVLIARMGIKHCHGLTMSRKAFSVLDRCGVSYSYDQLVDSLPCQTERVLSDDVDLEQGYAELSRRAGREDGAVKQVLSVTELHVSRESKKILRGVNFTVGEGEGLLLTGVNGSGKTTLLQSVAGLLPVISGSILLFGSDSRSPAWKKQRRLLAYVDQEQQSQRFPVSVEEVAAMGMAGAALSPEIRRKRLNGALEECQCAHLTGRSYFSLSGGEKRRVALARCLCQEARLLLLDEPFTFLDAEAREQLLELLERIRANHGISLLMVTHNSAAVRETGWRNLNLESGRLTGGTL